MVGTSGIRGPVGDAVTAALAVSVGRAVGVDADRVVVGRDPRESGVLLTDALTAGLRESGTDVLDAGLAATPTVARAVGWEDADAGVSVTASHNPPPDNGLKLWQPSGQAVDEGMRERIADRIREGRVLCVGKPRRLRRGGCHQTDVTNRCRLNSEGTGTTRGCTRSLTTHARVPHRY